jgi:hypothetical protein
MQTNKVKLIVNKYGFDFIFYLILSFIGIYRELSIIIETKEKRYKRLKIVKKRIKIIKNCYFLKTYRKFCLTVPLTTTKKYLK